MNKTNRCTEFQLYWYDDCTCFGQPFCPSSGVLSRTSALVHYMQLWWPFATRSRMILHSIKINWLSIFRFTYSTLSGIHSVVKWIVTGTIRFYSDVECTWFKAFLTSVLCISNLLSIKYCKRIWTLIIVWANTPF
jgi:hypothetical protein